MHAPNSNENNWKIKPGSRKSVQTDKRAIVQYVSSVDDALPNAPPKPKSLKTKYHSKSTSTANSSVVQGGSDEDSTYSFRLNQDQEQRYHSMSVSDLRKIISAIERAIARKESPSRSIRFSRHNPPPPPPRPNHQCFRIYPPPPPHPPSPLQKPCSLTINSDLVACRSSLSRSMVLTESSTPRRRRVSFQEDLSLEEKTEETNRIECVPWKQRGRVMATKIFLLVLLPQMHLSVTKT